MISKVSSNEAFVWIWLPHTITPIVAGKIKYYNGNFQFNYGKSYLEKVNDTKNPAISIYESELPLKKGILPLLHGFKIPGCIRDSSPDAWGRRVIINKKMGLKGKNIDTSKLDEITYLLESGSDRIGALDFQESPTEYIPRLSINPSLEELLESAERVEKGVILNPELDQALFHGSSIGGARPKALIQDGDRKYVAKFSSNTDLYNIVKAEFIAMKLAKIAGLSVASVKLVTASKKDILLVERFDRAKSGNNWERKLLISALTLLGLDEIMARYASYELLAEIIRHRFHNPKNTLRELFSRLVFNILCGNTDDHARNHAAIWDGKTLNLTPAYDICPQSRVGNEASQAMLIFQENNLSQLKNCLDTAHNFLLSSEEALEIINHLEKVIRDNWKAVCDESCINEADKKLLWQRQFLNTFCFEGL